jgi:hypothetical protein
MQAPLKTHANCEHAAELVFFRFFAATEGIGVHCLGLFGAVSRGASVLISSFFLSSNKHFFKKQLQ